MEFNIPDFVPAIPEMFVLGMACAVLLIDLFLKDSQRDWTYYLTQATLVGAFVLTLWVGGETTRLTFSGMFVLDQMAVLLKLFIYAVAFVVFLYSRPYLRERGLFKGEYYVLGLFAVLGMMVMVSAYSFLTVYLGLELLSLSLYAMVAFNRDSRQASEAAMKYFVLGALASGMLLYGMSMIYGVTGSLDLMEVSNHLIRSAGDMSVPLIFGLAFIVVGLGFKLGAVPFHMWVPDVYEGAPAPVTLFLGTAPKIAAFAMIIRVLEEGLGLLHADWQDMLIILAVLSLAVGNVIAIAQTNIKRMLAYSTIAHIGFVLLGLMAGTAQGYAAAMFYVVVYAVMATGAFGVIVFLSRNASEAERLDDFRGLNQRSPWMAFVMLLLMFSMTGVPPTVGFYAKLSVLQAVVQVDMWGLALYAVIMSVIGAFYYLRVVKLMYFDEAQLDAPLRGPMDVNIVLGANGLLMLGLGLFPGGLMALCAAAIVW
jgi:NADH-quinone oxidoreductase subunit N